MQNKLIRKEFIFGMMLLFVFTALVFPVNSEETPDLTGTWSGTLLQYPSSEFLYNVTIKQTGTAIEGESIIRTQTGQWYGIMEISGTISGESLTFEEISIKSQSHPWDWYWLLKSVSLTWSGGSSYQTLNGTWGTGGSYNQGTVNLNFTSSDNSQNNVEEELIDDIIFQDDFENYTLGTFPSNGGWQIVWNGAGDSYQVITESYSSSPTNSLQLMGRYGWSVVVKKDFTSSSDLIGYEVHMMASQGGGGSVAFFNKDAATWGMCYAMVAFGTDGYIVASEHNNDGIHKLQTYSPNTWYKIRAVVNKTSNLYNVWIDDVLKKSDIPISDDTSQIVSLQFQVGWVSIYNYFDDIVVFSRSESQNRLPNIPSAPTGPTVLNVGQSGTYSTSTTDPDGNKVQYMFDWDAVGAHSYSSFTSLTYSGQSTSVSHSYDKSGTYIIKTKARDELGLESSWSEGLTVLVNSLDNLIGYWNFDEGSGNIATDSSGSGNTGALVNNPVWVDGKSGKALNFNGVDNNVVVPDSNSLHLSSAVTVMTWVYLPEGAHYGDSRILSKDASNGGSNLALEIHDDSGHVALELGYGGGFTGPVAISTGYVPRNVWTHIATTYDGSVIKIYINGILDSTTSWATGFDTDNGMPLCIGSKNYLGSLGGASYEFWINATLDDVKIYNRALSQQEIQAEVGNISTSPSQKGTPGFETVATITAVATAGALVAFFRRRNRNR